MNEPVLSVVTDNGIFVTSELTDALDRQLKTIGQGVFHEEAAAAQQEILKKLSLNNGGKGKLIMEIIYTKKPDNDTVSVEGTVKSSVEARKYSTSAFITKNYLPSRERDKESK